MVQKISSSAIRICAVAACLVLAYTVALALFSHAGFPSTRTPGSHWPYLADKPVGEDGFYMLTVSDNLARTGHLVYTYDIPATGIQPLSTLGFAGIAFLTNHCGGDEWTLIRAIILFGGALLVVFAWQMARIAASLAPEERYSTVFQLAFCLVMLDFSLFRLFTYGLETGIYLVSIALCMHFWIQIVGAKKHGWSALLCFGMAAGIAGLARIDFGVFMAVLLLYLIITRKADVLKVLVSGAVALLIVSPWFIFVHKVNGTWLPSSGKAESELISLHSLNRLHSALIAIGAHLVPWSSVIGNRPETYLFCLVCAVFILGIGIYVRVKHPEAFAQFPAGTLTAWFPAIVILMTTYVVFFWSEHFYTRYFAPLLILTIPFLAVLFGSLSPFRRYGMVLCGLFVVAFGIAALASLNSGHINNSQIFYAGYLRQNYPHVRVGVFQSGDAAYFNRNVMNLDGKLNPAAKVAYFKHSLPEYLDSERLDVILDSPSYVYSVPKSYYSEHFEICPQLTIDAQVLCYVRKAPFDPSLGVSK